MNWVSDQTCPRFSILGSSEHVIYVLSNNVFSMRKSSELAFLVFIINWNLSWSEKISSAYFLKKFLLFLHASWRTVLFPNARYVHNFYRFHNFFNDFTNVAMNGNGNYTPLKVYHNGMGRKGQFRYWEVICTNEWRVLGITLQQWFHNATYKCHQRWSADSVCSYVSSLHRIYR